MGKKPAPKKPGMSKKNQPVSEEKFHKLTEEAGWFPT